MPTTRPRVMVTLTPELASTLDRVSIGTGQSRSALILDFLEATHPVLKQTADALDAVKKLKPRARAAFAQRVEQHERLAMSLLDAASQNLSLLTPPSKPARTRPPSVNKGGTTPSVSSDTPTAETPKVVSIRAPKRHQEPGNAL